MMESSPCFKELENAIAVIGMSCRFPEADNVEEYWDLLLNGKDGIRRVPNSRWVGDEQFANDPEVRNQHGGFLKCPVDEFDAKFFGISPREANSMDPQQRLLLEVTWESLENAGINPLELRGTTTAVFSGVWRQDYEKLLLKHHPESASGIQEFLKTSFSAISSRIAFQLGLIGPNVATESGCASSTVSLHLACQNLNLGTTDLAIVGGVNLLLYPFTPHSMNALDVISSDGKCKTFDASANGYGRAEGCASVILKRYLDAIKDGDKVLALIRGSAVSQEGTSSSFGTPTSECQAVCMHAALKNARVTPNMVSYIEAHGTGTIAGDPVEVAAIGEVYSSGRIAPLYIGSVKANIGHTESCAGLAGVIKVILSMQNKTIPPHIYCNNINPKIDLLSIRVCLPRSAIEWKTGNNSPRIAGVNSFGMTGTNVHVILQEAPSDSSDELANKIEQHKYQIVTISGKSEFSVKELINRYKTFLQSHPDDFERFCYTTNVHRAMLSRRVAVIGKDVHEIISSLEKGIFISSKNILEKSKVVFLFTGQGSHYFGMGKILYTYHPLFRLNFDKCSKLLKQHTNRNLADIIWTQNYLSQQEKMFYDQISIFCIEYCLWKLWQGLGIIPDFILGHSMGEFAASVAADILSFEDAFKMLIERSKLVEDMPEGGMLALKAAVKTVKGMIKKFLDNCSSSDWLDIAVINSDSQCVVAGRKEILERFSDFCEKNLIKTTFISSNRAYHSRDMEIILPKFDKILSKISFGVPKYKYVSSNTGEVVSGEVISKDYWTRNARNCVHFKDAFNLVLLEGGRVFIEIGPQPILLGIGNSIVNNDILKHCLWIPSMRKSGDEAQSFLEGLRNLYVNGFDINWKSFHQHFRNSYISIPMYPFEHSRKYWLESKKSSMQRMVHDGKVFHPLIGNKIFFPNSENVFHYQHFNLESLSYLRDHIIANKTIVAGATFMEMIVAAGHSAVQKSVDCIPKPVNPIIITDFVIKAAMEIHDGSDYVLCTDAKPLPENKKWSVTIQRQVLNDIGQISWFPHATGLFEYSQNDFRETINLEEIVTSFPSRDSEEMYSMIDKYAFNFRNTYRSIKTIWENDMEILAEVHTAESRKGYIIHPIILDAMVQSLVISPLSRRSNNVSVPISIQKFVLLPSNSLENSNKFYFFLKKSNKTNVKLFDETGNLVALMEGISTIETSIPQFYKALNSQVLSMPSLHEVVWRKAEKFVFDQSLLSPISSTNGAFWILFAEGKFSSYLKTKLEGLGNSVSLVYRGVTYSEINNEYTINPKDVSHITKIFQRFEASNVQGIIYMWGMESNWVDQSHICRPLLTVIQQLINSNFQKRLLLISRGVVDVSGEGIKNVASSTLLGLVKSAKAEQPDLNFISIDLDYMNIDFSADVDKIIYVMNNQNCETQYACRHGIAYVPRFTRTTFSNNIEIPVTSRFSLDAPRNNSIHNLSVNAANILTNFKKNEIEVSVIAAGLNFRDIMVIMKPEGYYTKYPFGLGTDYSGVVTSVGPLVKKFKIGDLVCGIEWNGALSSHITVHEDYAVQKPKNLTHFEAACFPAVFATAYHCIINVGMLSKGETILIHAASGGVGLISIQIAQQIGAEIIVTAGKDRKRLYLRSLGVKHVLDSRSINYAEEIYKITQGKGVDLVINTLTGINFKEMTLSICSQGARFIEISKANIWQPKDVAALRPDIKYTIFDLEQLPVKSLTSLLAKIEKFMPIPYTRFELKLVKDALKHLQKAEHIGKVVIAIPQFEFNESKPRLVCKLFSEESTYLITGGLGGIGLEVAKWMVELGAKSIVLIGRQKPNEHVSRLVQNFNEQGANIIPLQADVGKYNECEYIFNYIKTNLKPLRGIMHAAGSLADAVIENQKWENFENTFNSKVDGTVNLHKISRGCNLEHFILFSSITSTIGSIGQSSYIAANSFLDAFVHYRRGLGLPAQSINWGPWSEVRMAANNIFITDGALGIHFFSTKRALSALQTIIESHLPQISVSDLQPSVTLHSFPHLKPYFSELIEIPNNRVNGTQNEINLKRNVLKEIMNKTSEDQLEVIQKTVASIINSILKLDDSDSFNYTESFHEMGMDSLMTVELRNDLQEVFKDVPITSSIVLDYPSIEGLGKYIHKNCFCKAEPEEEELELRNTVRKDSNLCTNLKVENIFKRPQKFQNILLTGVTGSLGPYMLNELIKANPIAIITCIVRATSKTLAENRVQSVLMKNHIEQSIIKNCDVMNGDIGDENFSLTKEVYFNLTKTVDAVVHLAVKNNHIEKYKNRIGMKSDDIRTANVLGTRNVLEFAATNKSKFVFHGSSFIATTKNTLREEFPEKDNFGERITMGYAVTKFISEKLVKKGVDEGLHCVALRYPMILGSSETGQFFFESDHLMSLLLTCLRLNMLPKSAVQKDIPFIPVDIVAKISVKMFMNPHVDTGVYNCVGPNIWPAFQKVANEFGYTLKLVEDAVFRKQVIDEGKASLLFSLNEIYHREHGLEHLLNNISFFSSGISCAELKQSSAKFYRFVPEIDSLIFDGVQFLRDYFLYAKNNGILQNYCPAK